MHVKNKPSPDPNPIGHRLRLEMKKRGLTSAELAKRADVKTSFIYDIISGKSTNPSTVKLARVADILGISLTYLVGSTDRPAAESKPVLTSPGHEDYVTISRITVDIAEGGGKLISHEQAGERYYFRRDWIQGQLRAEPADLRMLYVRGDSMEPTLCHNDIILIDTTKKTPSPPGIFILFDGFGLVAKRLEYISDGDTRRIRIMSDNPQYSTYERSIDDIFIIGRIVWFAREM